MALGAALVDRGRTVRQQAQAVPKVRGATQFNVVRGDWFKVRLTLPAASESPDPGYRRRAVRAPTILYAMKDTAGQLIALSMEDRIEIVSKALGTAVWDVASQPEPIRKKRKQIGWLATLRRVEDVELPDAVVV